VLCRAHAFLQFTLAHDRGEITLRIEDTPPPPGVGITGMRQRLRQLGGRLELTSGDAGTVVTAIVPLPHEAEG
jgi:signal transduction histidine kinase